MNSGELQMFWAALDASQVDEAVTVCRRALERDPADWRATAAIELLVEQTSPSSPSGDLCRFTAQILESLGKLAEAAEYYRQAIQLAPNDVAARNNLGLLEVRFGNISVARRELEAAAQMAPTHPTILYNLGMALEADGQQASAEQSYRKSLALRPDYVDAMAGLAGIMIAKSRFDEAELSLQRAIAIDPNHAATKTHLGVLAAIRGDNTTAESQLRSCLAIDESNAAAWFYLSRMPHVCEQLELAPIIRLADDPKTPAANRAYANFAAANCLADAERHDEAFQRADTANRLLPCNYSTENHEQWVDDLLAAFNQSLLSDEQCRVAHIDNGRSPIFIVGLPRSGTTLVERILGRSKTIGARGGELAILRAVAERIPSWIPSTDRYPKAAARLNATVASQVAKEYYRRADSIVSGAAQFTDKTPANFLQIGLIHLAFPSARIVHCQRDVLDVATSCYFQYFEHQSFASRLETIGHYIQQYRRVMAHWKSVLPGRVINIEYEQLVRDPNETARRLTDQIGVAWCDSMLTESDDDTDVIATASNWQARQAIYVSSIGRWKRYAKHLASLQQMLEN